MDDAHAHPPSPAHGHTPTLHTRSRSIPPSLRDNQPNAITPKSAPHTGTRQQRLLQTRHARFSAQSLSVNSISNLPFPQLNRSIENDSPYHPSPRFTKRDGSERFQKRAEELSNASSESAILNEISSFNTYRIRGLKRRAAVPVFEDPPDKHSNPSSTYHDVYSDVHTFSIPDSLEDSPSMGLREVSVNLHRPSPGKDSPYLRSVRGGLSRKSSQAKAGFNPDDYIEHIENELQSTKDSMYSPTTHIPWKEKLKRAKEEINRLKKDMESMKSSFEFELHQAVEQSSETELTLKRKIKDLEDELGLNQTVIHDLECDREEDRFDQSAQEVLRARIEKLEEEKFSLEATNHDMTRRNDVLTQLLALSPTKTQPAIEMPGARRRSARPMSLIIPRLPSSPGIRTTQCHSRPQSVLGSPPLLASDYFGGQLPSSPLASSPGPMDDTRSVDSGIGESCAPIVSGTGSRRSTLASHASTSPGMENRGHSRAESRSQTILRNPSKRRPRKFMPGSTQLKPLLLPTFTADYGNLPSTSPFTSPIRQYPPPIAAHIIGYDLPPVVQPVTSYRSETTFSSPEHVAGRPGPAFQSLDEVFAEDATHFQAQALDERLNRHAVSDPARQYGTPIRNEMALPAVSHEDLLESHSHPRVSSWVLKTISSLPEDNEGHSSLDPLGSLALNGNPDVPSPLFSKNRASNKHLASIKAAYSESPLPPRIRRKNSSPIDSTHSKIVLLDDVSMNTQLDATECPYRGRASTGTEVKILNPLYEQTIVTDRQASVRARNPLELLQQRSVATRPLASLTIRTVYATLSRYTTYIEGFKRDPLALARRVIANAWRSNWAMFGKMSWWVLGLFISYRRLQLRPAKWDWERYDGESIAQRHCSAAAEDVSANNPCTARAENAPYCINDDEGRSVNNEENASSTAEPKAGWGHSLFLWGKFSVAIMLAVGGAIVKGPAEMLRDVDERRRSRSPSLAEAVDGGHAIPERQDSNESGIPTNKEQHSPGEIPASSTRPPDGVRKARSSSSPPTSPETHRQRGAMSYTHELTDDFLSINDKTLKPARSERQGMQSIFRAPQNIDLGECSSPSKPHRQKASVSSWSTTTAVPS